ncbi:MAG: sugar ABC transporter permease [Chloroflexi bacterium]|nr:sugar ABC transporter permease [Chloroflexota bacterium]
MTKRRNLAPWLLVLPSALYLAVFFATPMAQSFALALQDSAGSWSLESVQLMLGDPDFGRAVSATLTLLVLVIPIQLALALAMAIVINKRLRGTSLWLYCYALPLAISELAAGIVWVSIFTQRGWLNSILQSLGILDRGVIWMSGESYWMLIGIIVVAEAWRATSIMMIILVAGLQSIPDEYLEAAEVYGASLWQRIRRVILPMLRPSLQVALILRVILAIQVFATAVALAGTGLTVMSQQALDWANDIDNDNVAAAWAGLMLVISLTATVGILWLLPVREEQRQ